MDVCQILLEGQKSEIFWVGSIPTWQLVPHGAICFHGFMEKVIADVGMPIYHVVEKGAESVLHKVPIVVGNLRELNHHTLSVLPSSHKGIGAHC